MSEKIADFIIGSLWTFFLFGLWLLLSLNQGTEGEWWSLFTLDLGRPSDSALGISFFRMFIAFSLSILIAYFLTSWWGRKKKHSSS
ncbi:hypothetical protein [Priestia abyssalis]|uniref:hypothetical protein n=1 Tax=Priestia abyssalis TaxID=1221450 RepID=UPI00099548B2|nr:hypothetical protein [Priestia abyssalis]